MPYRMQSAITDRYGTHTFVQWNREESNAESRCHLFYRLILFAAAVLPGSHAAVFPETLCQITLRGKSGKMSNIRNFMVCILQEIFAYFNPAASQIADRGDPVVASKFVAQIIFIQMA